MYVLESEVLIKYDNICDKIAENVGVFSYFKTHQKLCKKGFPRLNDH